MADETERILALFRERATEVYVNAWASGYGSGLASRGVDEADAKAEAMALALQMFRDPIVRYEMEAAATRVMQGSEPSTTDQSIAFTFRAPHLTDAAGRVWTHDVDVFYTCDGERLPLDRLEAEHGPMELPEQ